MPREIERKFLVDSSDLEKIRPLATSADRIIQGYVSKGGGNTVRVRIRNGKSFMTIKGPSLDGGLSRYEWEFPIPMERARELMELCGTSVIDKTRYLVPEILPDGSTGKHVFEVDEYYGPNKGLVTAEVELGDVLEEFNAPSWLGLEVTSDRRYSNASLSVKPFSEF